MSGTGWKLAHCDKFYEADGVTEKIRSYACEEKTGAWMMLQGICDLFFAYPQFDGERREVAIYSRKAHDGLMEITFGKNTENIRRRLDSSALVTRLYVQGDYTDNGYVGIEDAKNNESGLGYIFNFDYYCEECQVKKSTKKTYGTARRRIGESTLGEMKVAHVKPMDCRKFISELKNAGVSIYTARTACYLLKRTFDLAEEDGLILRNPVGASCLEMVRVNAGTREALTEEQMASFLNVIMKDKVGQKSYDGIVLLFETGLRISEMVGLRLEDIDLTRRKISVRQQLAADKTETETKSAAGVREIPMTDMAYLSLKRILSDRNSKKVKAGFEEYVFIGKNGEAMDAGGWRQKFRRLRAKWEKRAPELATEVTPHICRHTFCSRLMAAGMNPKAVQYLMGHEDAAVTMNVYTHMTYSQVEQEMRKAKFA